MNDIFLPLILLLLIAKVKVERSHREDHNKFYSCHSFYSCDDLNAQLTVRLNRTNNRPMRPLNWFSPIEFFHEHRPI